MLIEEAIFLLARRLSSEMRPARTGDLEGQASGLLPTRQILPDQKVRVAAGIPSPAHRYCSAFGGDDDCGLVCRVEEDQRVRLRQSVQKPPRLVFRSSLAAVLAATE